MADDIASLGFSIDSDPLVETETRLRAMEAAAKRAGVSVEEMQARIKRASTGSGPIVPNLVTPPKLPWSVPQITEIDKGLKNITASGLTQQQMWRSLTHEIGLLNPHLAEMVRHFGFVSQGLGHLPITLSILAVSFAAMSAVVIKSLEAFASFEKESIQMDNALALVGGQSGQTAKSLHNLAEELSSSGVVTKEAAVASERALLVFKNIGPEAFGPALDAAKKLSETGLVPMETAAKALGEAINNPIMASQALSKVFVELTTVQQQQINAAVRAGDVLKAQSLVMEAVDAKSKGINSTAQTLTAQWTAMTKSFEDFLITIGGAIALLTNLGSVLSVISNAIKDSIAAMKDLAGAQTLSEGRAGPGGVKMVLTQGAAFEQPHMSEAQFRPIIQGLEAQAAAQKIAADASKMGAGAAAAYTAAETVRQQAIRDGLPLDAAQEKELQAVTGALGGAKTATELSNLAWEIQIDRLQATGKLTDAQTEAVQKLVPIVGRNLSAALANSNEKLLEYNTRLKQAKSTTDSAVSGIGSALTSGLADLVDGTKDVSAAFADMSKAVVRALDEMIIKLAIVGPLENALKPIFASAGSLFVPGAATGGVLGRDSFPHSLVSAAAFAGAPHFASGGMVGGGIPVIAHAGEGIFTKGQMAAMGGGGAQVVNVNVQNNAGAKVSVDESRGDDGSQQIGIMIERVESAIASRITEGRSSVGRATANVYGLTRQAR